MKKIWLKAGPSTWPLERGREESGQQTQGLLSPQKILGMQRYSTVLYNSERFFFVQIGIFSHLLQFSVPDNGPLPISPQQELSLSTSQCTLAVILLPTLGTSPSATSRSWESLALFVFLAPTQRRLFPKMFRSDSHFRYLSLPWALKLWSVEYEQHHSCWCPQLNRRKSCQDWHLRGEVTELSILYQTESWSSALAIVYGRSITTGAFPPLICAYLFILAFSIPSWAGCCQHQLTRLCNQHCSVQKCMFLMAQQHLAPGSAGLWLLLAARHSSRLCVPCKG